MYGESTDALVSEIGRRITEAAGENRKTFWLEQMLDFAVQRGISILMAVRKKYNDELGAT